MTHYFKENTTLYTVCVIYMDGENDCSAIFTDRWAANHYGSMLKRANIISEYKIIKTDKVEILK